MCIRDRFAQAQIEGLPGDQRLTASFGVAGRGEGEGYGKLFARTDGALYAAKENGRNCIVRDGEGKKRGVVTSIAELADKRHEANA